MTLSIGGEQSEPDDPTTKEASMRKILSAAASIVSAVLVTAADAQQIDWHTFTEPFVSAARAQDVDWQKFDEFLGRESTVSGDVHRYGFPHTEQTETQDEVSIKPALALGGWLA